MKREKFYQDLVTGKFTSMVKETVKGQSLSNAKGVFNVIKPLTEQETDVEQFWVFFLDAKNSILEMSMMFKGSITSASVYPRELIKKVLAVGASAIVCCHNHPSGDPEPSPEDYTITFQILIALKSIGVTLHDHMVIGDNGYHSMADHGVILSLNSRYDRLIKG